jgi:hypothetical protein
MESIEFWNKAAQRNLPSEKRPKISTAQFCPALKLFFDRISQWAKTLCRRQWAIPQPYVAFLSHLSAKLQVYDGSSLPHRR